MYCDISFELRLALWLVGDKSISAQYTNMELDTVLEIISHLRAKCVITQTVVVDLICS